MIERDCATAVAPIQTLKKRTATGGCLFYHGPADIGDMLPSVLKAFSNACRFLFDLMSMSTLRNVVRVTIR
jgi:hypothetical protein